MGPAVVFDIIVLILVLVLICGDKNNGNNIFSNNVDVGHQQWWRGHQRPCW